MQMFMRKIRLFFVQYGRLLVFAIGSIIIFLFLLKSVDNYYKETRIKDGLKIKENKVIAQKEQEDESRKKIISDFIDNCNTGKNEEAYKMLTDNCKNEKFKTISEFQNKYINTLFSINICEYKIENKNETYIVYLTEDMLITGKTDSQKQTKIKLYDNKIYIIN